MMSQAYCDMRPVQTSQQKGMETARGNAEGPGGWLGTNSRNTAKERRKGSWPSGQ